MIGNLIRALKDGTLTPTGLEDLCRRLDEIEARDNILRAWMQPGSLDPSVGALLAGRVEVVDRVDVAGNQVLGARVVDARCDDALNSGDATTDGVIDSLRDAMISHGLIAAA